LITADYALEQGRELVVHRVGTSGERGEGCRRLAQQGAEIIESADDILADWGWLDRRPENQQRSAQPYKNLKPGEQLARALESEMAGHLVYRSGRVFERNIDGK
jgi:DNA processing protein